MDMITEARHVAKHEAALARAIGDRMLILIEIESLMSSAEMGLMEAAAV